MSRFARRTDETHAPIREAFRAAGFSVWDTARQGNGGPDFVAALRGQTVMVECKRPTRKDGGVKPSAISAGQRNFAASWNGIYIVATDPSVAVLKALEAIR